MNDAILQGMEIEPEKRTPTVLKFRENLGLVVQPRRTPPPNPLPASEEGGLKSSCEMDYRKLRDYLAQGKWKEADEETLRVMLAVAKREMEGWLDDKSIDNFPCEDLRTIDHLWLKYSNGRLGFSVQKRIYQGLVGTGEWDGDIRPTGDKVGWRKRGNWLYYNDITFDKKAPEGHLPSLFSISWGSYYIFRWEYFFSHVETCKL
ncbi:MAG: GUN4 domain-containing protein [Nostocales cyanobacterium ELA583]